MNWGYQFGITEGSSIFKRGNMYYALFSVSAWDSAYYSTFFVAATSISGLDYTANPITGRLLIGSLEHAFGHGDPVLGPDGVSWYYISHHMYHPPCLSSG